MKVPLTLIVNELPYDVARRAGSLAPRRDPRRPRPHRDEGGLRRLGVRRVHGPARRAAGELVLVPRPPGGRPAGHDGRGARHRRTAERPAAGVPRGRRRAVRVLHAGHAHLGDGPARANPGHRATRRSGPGSPATSAAAPATRRSWPGSRPPELAAGCARSAAGAAGRPADGPERRRRGGAAHGPDRLCDARSVSAGRAPRADRGSRTETAATAAGDGVDLRLSRPGGASRSTVGSGDHRRWTSDAMAMLTQRRPEHIRPDDVLVRDDRHREARRRQVADRRPRPDEPAVVAPGHPATERDRAHREPVRRRSVEVAAGRRVEHLGQRLGLRTLPAVQGACPRARSPSSRRCRRPSRPRSPRT